MPSLPPIQPALTSLDAGGAPFGFAGQPSKLFARPTDNQIRSGRILIIDDERADGREIRNHLYSWGFRKFSLESHAKCSLDTVSEINPDIVILDTADHQRGLQILEGIRKHAALHHLPVIIITENESTEWKLQALRASADDFLAKPIDSIELIARVRNTISNKLMRDQISNYSVELQSDVLTDELTQIANRRAFDYELKRRLLEWQRQRNPISLLLIDIDFFKQVNDNYGHGIGDQVLQKVAARISECVRDMDLVARYGGEEFAVILPSTSAKDSCMLAERIRMKICEAPIEVGSDELNISASIGVANSMNGDDLRLISLRADEALYESKRLGRNRTCRHDGAGLISVTAQKQTAPVVKEKKMTVGCESGVRARSILAIDDEPLVTMLLERLLTQNGFINSHFLNDPTQVVQEIDRVQPDLLLLDIHMPHLNGLEILKELRRDPRTERLPVVILTAATDAEVKVKSLGLGATDVLHKPVNEKELVARVCNTLMAKAHLDALADYSSRLEKHVRLRTAELMASRREAIQVLARAAESRDDSSGRHILRVGRYAATIAEEIGFSMTEVTNLEQAAQLHDVGKIAMPDKILRKPGKLTEEEFEYMKRHCFYGANIIRDATLPVELESGQRKSSIECVDECNSPVMRLAAIVAESHHEKWDGSGYPNGLRGEEIPIEGRITAIADVFDALSTQRCYKDAMLLDECFKTIQSCAGTHFDPDIVEAFMRRRFDIMEIFQSYREEPPAS